jgi:hypothetical protein
MSGIPNLAGKHVALVAMGPSCKSFLDVVPTYGGASAFCDEVWGINCIGDALRCDRVFHMDDVRVQQRRADAAPNTNIAMMVKWLKRYRGPVYTSHVEPGFPGLVEYPLAEVVKETKEAYFNGTVAYAVALAICAGVRRLSIFGCDYTYPNAHKAEKGRACLEYWLGIAKMRGVQIVIPKSSTLMDAIEGNGNRFYGYDGYNIALGDDFEPVLTPKELPTAEEIEDRYDHARHPNALVAAEAEDGAGDHH